MKTPFRLSDDELRLIQLFRALDSEPQRGGLLERLARDLFATRYPGRSVYDFMPQACGIDPGTVIKSALEATGDPAAALLGTSARDDAQLIPQFAVAAAEAALDEGEDFDHDESALRGYLEAWRWELVWAIRRQKQAEDLAS